MATTCDICKKRVGSLTPLLDNYQTDDIKEVCGDCERIVNDHLSTIKRLQYKMTASLLKRFMNLLKG